MQLVTINAFDPFERTVVAKRGQALKRFLLDAGFSPMAIAELENAELTMNWCFHHLQAAADDLMESVTTDRETTAYAPVPVGYSRRFLVDDINAKRLLLSTESLVTCLLASLVALKDRVANAACCIHLASQGNVWPVPSQYAKPNWPHCRSRGEVLRIICGEFTTQTGRASDELADLSDWRSMRLHDRHLHCYVLIDETVENEPRSLLFSTSGEGNVDQSGIINNSENDILQRGLILTSLLAWMVDTAKKELGL